MRRPARLIIAAFGLALAAGGCSNLLGIEDLSAGGDDPDARPDGSGVDAQQEIDASPDAPIGPIRIGFPNQFAERATLTSGFIWAMDLRVTQPVRLDQLGIILLLPNNTMAHLGLYGGDPNRPIGLIERREFVQLSAGVNEIDIADVDLLPGTYWFAMMFEREVDVGAGAAADPSVQLAFAGGGFTLGMPGMFPNPTVNAVKALNVYLIVNPL